MGISLKMGDKTHCSLSVVNILLNKETLVLNWTAESKNPKFLNKETWSSSATGFLKLSTIGILD